MEAKLVAIQADIQPRFVVLNTTTCTIGRSPLCRVVVQHNTVSRLHAKIEMLEHAFVLSDTGSVNGTFVNGQRIATPYQLQDRDVIGAGDMIWALQFCSSVYADAVIFEAAAEQ